MRKIIVLVLLVFLPLAVSASRNDGKWLQYKQPNGSVLTVRFCGDEHYTYYVTQAGTLMNKGEDGFLHVISKDELQREISRARASEGTVMPRKARLKTNWDPTKVYKSPVILVSFSNMGFSVSDNPKAYYDSLFNFPGFNKGVGPGCVADYWREQSKGLFNPQFDVFGPVFVADTAGCYSSPGNGTFRIVLRNALIKAVDSLGVDFSQYDWDGDGYMEQPVFIYSGYGGNDGRAPRNGYINPHTATFPVYRSNGVAANWYTCSAERWAQYEKSCGIGTICHEFLHSLGLPDIYPTAGNEFSVIDEWDLMDGGNFTNWGWCPPNLTTMEKMQLGWLEPEELTEPTTITDMKSVADHGTVYKISHTENEFFLLENRQWRGWDSALPGKGLAIFHVYYDYGAWHVSGDGGNNSVNNKPSMHRFDLVYADNMGYEESLQWVKVTYKRRYLNNKEMLNSFVMSGSTYPLVTDTLVNRELTTVSTPAMKIYEIVDEGVSVLDKPITNIRMSESGLISFDFMGGNQTGIANHHCENVNLEPQLYDLSGRKVSHSGRRGLYLRRDKNGVVRKMF